MTPDTTALRARLRDDCALCGHNHQPYVEVPREDFIALCDAADAAERLRANGNGYLQRAHAAEAVIERMRCAHCGEVGCDWIGDIRKARAEMAEAERDASRTAHAGLVADLRALVGGDELVSQRAVNPDEYTRRTGDRVPSYLAFYQGAADLAAVIRALLDRHAPEETT